MALPPLDLITVTTAALNLVKKIFNLLLGNEKTELVVNDQMLKEFQALVKKLPPPSDFHGLRYSGGKSEIEEQNIRSTNAGIMIHNLSDRLEALSDADDEFSQNVHKEAFVDEGRAWLKDVKFLASCEEKPREIHSYDYMYARDFEDAKAENACAEAYAEQYRAAKNALEELAILEELADIRKQRDNCQSDTPEYSELDEKAHALKAELENRQVMADANAPEIPDDWQPKATSNSAVGQAVASAKARKSKAAPEPDKIALLEAGLKATQAQLADTQAQLEKANAALSLIQENMAPLDKANLAAKIEAARKGTPPKGSNNEPEPS
jgi:hypothetical protein